MTDEELATYFRDWRTYTTSPQRIALDLAANRLEKLAAVLVAAEELDARLMPTIESVGRGASLAHNARYALRQAIRRARQP